MVSGGILNIIGPNDENAKFIDVFVGPLGRVHDARMLRHSAIYVSRHNIFGDRWKLLGDSSHVCRDFLFILTPRETTELLQLRTNKETHVCVDHA